VHVLGRYGEPAASVQSAETHQPQKSDGDWGIQQDLTAEREMFVVRMTTYNRPPGRRS
jgi:hypothetical protein